MVARLLSVGTVFLDLFTYEDELGHRKLNSIGVLLMLGGMATTTLLAYERYQIAMAWIKKVDDHVYNSEKVDGYVAELRAVQQAVKRSEDSDGRQQSQLERIERKMDAMLLSRGISPASIQ